MDENESPVVSEQEWRKYPRYLADIGGLFGAPPQLKCRGCSGMGYELFYGHCRKCAKKNNIPMETANPQAFHDAVNSGMPAVIEGVPKVWYPWWNWKRYFPSKWTK